MGKLDNITPSSKLNLYTVKIEVEGVTVGLYRLSRECVEQVDSIAKVLSDIDVDNAEFYDEYNNNKNKDTI